MSVFTKYNNTGGNFDYQTPETHEYKNLSELYNPDMDNTFRINAMYINTKGKFGNAPVVVTDNEQINLPMHLTDTVTKMINDPEVVHSVNQGDGAIEIYEYTTVKWGKHYSVNFVPMKSV